MSNVQKLRPLPGQEAFATQPIMSGLLSKDTSYRLSVFGDFGSREIGNLIKFLEIQKQWAEEEEAETLQEPEYYI